MSSSIEFIRSGSWEDAVARAAAEQRIDSGYWDIFHKHHDVSTDVRKRILSALGWNVESQNAIDAERERRFRSEYTSVLPATAVIDTADRRISITLPQSEWRRELTIRFALEQGDKLSVPLDLNTLPQQSVLVGSEAWIAYQWTVPTDVPLGYHTLELFRGEELLGKGNLILCPERAYLPDDLAHGSKAAGFNVTLYGLRSQRNWGCGDFTDLQALIDWAHTEVGFSFIGLNPLHALHNRVPYNTSPYLPLSLYYKNLIYIDVEAVPEFAGSKLAQCIFRSDSTRRKLDELRGSEFVAYHEIDSLKRRFLKVLFRQFLRTQNQHPERARAFDQFCEREGAMLHKFALYCALDEVLHKQDRNRWTWHHWPLEYQQPGSEACLKFAEDHHRLLQFYQYIQFVIEEQLSAAQSYAKQRGMPIGLYHDLALATDSCGADLWAYRNFYVNGCRVGAPPDDFSPSGQDWAFPPPSAEAHRKDGYHLYRESISKIVSHGGALRIDHVMRLFRLFWIPESATAAEGTYVRDYASDLMRILALESVRSQNIVIGEDLGTVTDEIREMLARFRILSYRLFYFEKHPNGTFKHSHDYPRQALVASSTHDLATMCGFWLGRDIQARKEANLVDEAGAAQQFEARNTEKQNMLNVLHAENLLPHWYERDSRRLPEIDGELHNAIVGFLARVPSMLLLLNQEDLTKELQQQNLPGSTSEYPNWQRKMRAPVEELRSSWAPFAGMFRNQLSSNGRSNRVNS